MKRGENANASPEPETIASPAVCAPPQSHFLPDDDSLLSRGPPKCRRFACDTVSTRLGPLTHAFVHVSLLLDIDDLLVFSQGISFVLFFSAEWDFILLLQYLWWLTHYFYTSKQLESV